MNDLASIQICSGDRYSLYRGNDHLRVRRAPAGAAAATGQQQHQVRDGDEPGDWVNSGMRIFQGLGVTSPWFARSNHTTVVGIRHFSSRQQKEQV